ALPELQQAIHFHRALKFLVGQCNNRWLTPEVYRLTLRTKPMEILPTLMASHTVSHESKTDRDWIDILRSKHLLFLSIRHFSKQHNNRLPDNHIVQSTYFADRHHPQLPI